ELDALAAYVASLGKDSVKRSPYRTYTGELTLAAERGQQLFTTLNCASCHTGQAFRDGQSHDVGTISETSGNRLAGELSVIRTPTLIELWETAPYFHDGSAATLNDVFDVAGHQLTFTGSQEADLIEFLRSIDQELFIDDEAEFPES
ncbi:MAG: cytochrome c peroxidase, partial [Anaerolineae bacterium]